MSASPTTAGAAAAAMRWAPCGAPDAVAVSAGARRSPSREPSVTAYSGTCSGKSRHAWAAAAITAAGTPTDRTIGSAEEAPDRRIRCTARISSVPASALPTSPPSTQSSIYSFSAWTSHPPEEVRRDCGKTMRNAFAPAPSSG